MSSVSNIFVALAFIFGGGYALDKIYVTVRTAALQEIHRGMPPLSEFTNRLTCSKISTKGELVPAKCGHKPH